MTIGAFLIILGIVLLIIDWTVLGILLIILGLLFGGFRRGPLVLAPRSGDTRAREAVHVRG